jgi:hypothetical protein
MAKVGEKRKQKKPSKKDQYGRFLETVRNLGVAEKESRETFERAFSKIVPPKRRPL